MNWKLDQTRRRTSHDTRRRTRGPERLEARRLLAADPIHVGVVYLETDYLESDQDVGSDSRGDRFILSFTGGAPDTQLSELRIRTDKDGDGISVGDPIYDTALGGRGKNGAHGFQIVRVQSADGHTIDATAEVEDGGQELILRLSNFRAGDRLEFTIDVDEVLRNAIDLAVFNDRLDVITSGQEFQDSILEATFDAPHYEKSSTDAVFLNDYGDPATTHGLNLPADEGEHVDSRPNRSAAAVGSSIQTPKPIEISGQVWIDNDLDSVREPGEKLLAGIEISLWKQLDDGSYVDTGHRSDTDGEGRYVFAKSLGLAPGQYRVEESQPQGLYSVAAVPGTVDGRATGVAESVDSLSGIDLPLGDLSAINYDFAEAEPASLSGFVYRDSNNDGRRDAAELGIAGVRIQLVPILTLSPQSVLTVTTSDDGSYQFTGLAPGSYEVIEVDQPADLNDGLDAAGTVNGIVVGMAENPGDRIVEIVLAGSEQGIEYNFGEVPLGSLSGFVYLAVPGQDCTGDHLALGSTPLVGAHLALQTESGTTVARTTSGTDGGYTFDNLPVGNYRIVEFTPNFLIDGSSHVGRIGDVQVGTSVSGGLIQDITMTPAGVGVEYNFCEAAPASISGYVYHDSSNDGIRDAAETPIPGVRIGLIDERGKLVATTDTDQNGRYQFVGVQPGEYSIVEQQPTRFLDGIDSVGTIRGQTVGSAASNDTFTSVKLNQGDAGVEYNFGELLPASLFGRVHVDLDDDCELDEGEATLAGVTIRLLDAGGTEVATTTTDAKGEYSFTNLAPGTYTVVEEQPAGFFTGKAKAGSGGGVVEGSNRISNITLESGETVVGYDFCEKEGAEIVGSVFSDRDGDCVFDAHETGITGVQVELYDQLGDLVATTVTDGSGNYRFTNLSSGIYTVREIQPAGWLQGGQKAGSGGGDDSVTDVISLIPLVSGQRLTQYNFCELEPASISGIVFVDGNGDCLHDTGEPPIEGVTIELLDAGGQFIAGTTTDANGRYHFGNLRPGRYQISELQPAGYFHGGQGPGETLGADLLGVNLAAGQHLVNNNFCELAPSSLSGIVHVDEDGDCRQDPDEQTLEGVAIELRDADGNVVARTTTSADGRYHFEGLPPGQYQIFELQPEGLYQGGQLSGTGDGTVLGDDLLGAGLLSGQHLVDYNFCELLPSWISGKVWQESDPNQRFEPGDTPLPGVMVELIDHQGDVLAQTKTDAEGNYKFTPLAPGVYAVREIQPSGFFHGGQVVGDAGGQVGGDDLLVGITLLGGTHASNYDFPEVPPATLSGFVFQDGDAITLSETPEPRQLREYRDGRLTSDDARLSGVTVTLRNVLGLPFDASRALPGFYDEGPIQTTTDENGYYEFKGLRPGTYHVYQVQPDKYVDGLDTPGTTGGVAVNPADELEEDDRITIQTLALSEQTDPRSDAILNISLAGGSQSAHNNFSEIVIAQPVTPPPDVPLQRNNSSSPAAAPIETIYDPPVRIVTYLQPATTRPYLTDLLDEWAVSWHLSVINGGFPRGTLGESGILGEDGVIHGVAAVNMRDHWVEGEHTRGKWRIASRDGSIMKLSDRITLGAERATALAGDFDGNGIDEAAIFVGGQWFVDLNGNGIWDAGDMWIGLGTELDRPVVGDWDGDGKDDIGIFGRQWLRDPQRIKKDPGLPDPANQRRRQVDLRNLVAQREDRGQDRQRLLRRGNDGSLRADAVDHVFQYGEQVDTPMAGDWNGDGIDQIAVFRGGQWLLDANGDGRWTSEDQRADFGRPGDQPIVGDFNGDDIDEIGVVRGDLWIIDTDGDRRITGNDLRIVVPRDSEDSQPVVGDFDGDGQDDPGYYDEAA